MACVRVCVCVRTRVCVRVFGSLGHVHKNVIKGLQLGGLQKKLAKFSSAIIGSIEMKMFCISSSCESVPVILQTDFPRYLDAVFVACLVDPNKRRKCVCLKVCLAKLYIYLIKNWV